MFNKPVDNLPNNLAPAIEEMELSNPQLRGKK